MQYEEGSIRVPYALLSANWRGPAETFPNLLN